MVCRECGSGGGKSRHTEVILFDIASVKIGNDDTFTRVIAKQFYEHQGLAGGNLKAARLERHLIKNGKYETFKESFLSQAGITWEEARDSMAFYEDAVENALVSTGLFTAEAATHWFDGEEKDDISIEELTNQIKEYLDSKGKDSRILFMIDEVVQYIGQNVNLMLDLQTLVEQLGSKCQGRAWVIVTGQEDIDSFTHSVRGDFSKILGRFDTRIKLSSSSVDEVVKQRLLTKTENARLLLKNVYDTKAAVLKNLFVFTSDTVKDLKGYESAEQFAQLYPLVPYQLRLEQEALERIRRQGMVGRSHSDGARSMIPSCQKAILSVSDKDENALVPFSAFFESMYGDLEGQIQRVIDRCATAADKNEGLEPYDVEILKALFLIRYVVDIKSNLENITILMIDRIDVDKIALRAEVQKSLERLVSQNYVSRSGDIYSFLTDEEQDIAKDIKNTSIDQGQITKEIANTIFGDIFHDSKIRYPMSNGQNKDFDFNRMVDDYRHGTVVEGMTLRFITPLGEDSNSGNFQWTMASEREKACYVILNTDSDFIEPLREAAKIKKYYNTRNINTLPESTRRILENKMRAANSYGKEVRTILEKAVQKAVFYIAGNRLESVRGASAAEKIKNAMEDLVQVTYDKIDLIRHAFTNDDEVRDILRQSSNSLHPYSTDNQEAVDEVEKFIQTKAIINTNLSVGDIQRHFAKAPYGWREIDIASCLAELIRAQKVQIEYQGTPLRADNGNLVDYLRKRTLIDSVSVRMRKNASEVLIRKVREILKEYLDKMDVPNTEDELCSFIVKTFQDKNKEAQEIYSNYNHGNYPGKDVVEKALGFYKRVLEQSKDNIALLEFLRQNENELLDLKDDFADISNFFQGSQKSIFESAVRELNRMKEEKDYLMEDSKEALIRLKDIVNDSKPYRRINEIPTLIQKIDEDFQSVLEDKKKGYVGKVDDILSLLDTYSADYPKEQIEKQKDCFENRKKEIESLDKVSSIELRESRLDNEKEKAVITIINTTNPTPTPNQKAETVRKTIAVRKADLLPDAILTTEQDIEKYLEKLREELKNKMKEGTSITIL